MKSAIRMSPLLLAALALPAMAQTFAPAPRALAPAAAVHPCMAPPQGQGPTSTECKRECERNPQVAQCARSSAAAAPAVSPNWGAAPGVVPAPGPLGPAAPVASAQPADGGTRPATPQQMQRAPTATANPQAGPAPTLPAGTPAPSPMTTSAPAPSATLPAAARGATGGVPSVPATTAAPLGPAPVIAAGGGSAPPGGVPVRLPQGGASVAAANSGAPGKTEPAKFDREAFDVDFGPVYSGEQVRRTVVLNTNARGEAEFRLTTPNAPGFAITEIRVMGQGVLVPPTSATQAPLPSNAPRQLQDSAVRKVIMSVKSAPWKVQFNGPSELQIDVVYAPKVDLFNNLIEKKMGVLDAGFHNAGGSTGASIALRADFRGLKEVNAASLKPRESPVLVVVEPDVTNFKVSFDIAALSAPIDGVLRQTEDVPGFRFADTPVRIAAGRSGIVTVNGQFASLPTSTADARERVIPVALTWHGGSARSSVTVIPVPPKTSFHSPMLQGCGVDTIGVMFHVRLARYQDIYYAVGSATATTFNSDPLRDANVQFELLANGKPVCAAYPQHRRVTGKSAVDKSTGDACQADLEDYLAIVRGAVRYRCRPVKESCYGDFSDCQKLYGAW